VTQVLLIKDPKLVHYTRSEMIKKCMVKTVPWTWNFCRQQMLHWLSHSFAGRNAHGQDRKIPSDYTHR